MLGKKGAQILVGMIRYGKFLENFINQSFSFISRQDATFTNWKIVIKIYATAKMIYDHAFFLITFL